MLSKSNKKIKKTAQGESWFNKKKKRTRNGLPGSTELEVLLREDEMAKDWGQMGIRMVVSHKSQKRNNFQEEVN